MPRSNSLLLTLVVLSLPAHGLLAQYSAERHELQDLMGIFFMEIGSPSIEIDRQIYQNRLIGELASREISQYKGMFPPLSSIVIDSIIKLPTLYDTTHFDPTLKLPPKIDSVLRRILYVTSSFGVHKDNMTLFVVRDSLWKIEAFRQFPSPAERGEIASNITNPDFSSDKLDWYGSLTRLLQNDSVLMVGFSTLKDDIALILVPLTESNQWRELDLQTIEFDSLDEYGGLDDSISESERFFFQLNHRALQRLNQKGVLKIIQGSHGLLFFELGSYAGKSLGFLHSVQTHSALIPSKEIFYTVKPIDKDWWLFKGVTDGVYQLSFVPEESIGSKTDPFSTGQGLQVQLENQE